MAETRYLPYGEERWTAGGAQPTDFTFTSQRAECYTHLEEYKLAKAPGSISGLGHFRVVWFLDKGRKSVYNRRGMNILKHIREQTQTDNYQFSIHAEREREDEHILVEELEQSVARGELLEDYPDDPRGHSCLILGFTQGGRAIHSVWGLLPDGQVRVITVYIPLPPKWIDPRTRRSGT